MAVGSEISSCNDDWMSPLCVPQDKLEDIKFHKDFNNDLISLSDFFGASPKLKSTTYWNEVSSSDMQSSLEDVSRFGIAKKRRSKRSRESSRIVNDYLNKIRWDVTKRKCYHCQTESTPQWRMGPLGPKTLCNACGVRYKAGKLLPEYRPVASPTFDGKKHSNFHKRVLQRRFGNMNLVRFR